MPGTIFVFCEHCGGEGRRYYAGHNCWDEIDAGPCLACEGTGIEEVQAEPMTLEDLEVDS